MELVAYFRKPFILNILYFHKTALNSYFTNGFHVWCCKGLRTSTNTDNYPQVLQLWIPFEHLSDHCQHFNCFPGVLNRFVCMQMVSKAQTCAFTLSHFPLLPFDIYFAIFYLWLSHCSYPLPIFISNHLVCGSINVIKVNVYNSKKHLPFALI